MSYRLPQPKVLSKRINQGGYYYVNLMDSSSKTTKYRSVSIHSLVASTFIYKHSLSLCVNHIDGNKLNNVVNNLEWVTIKENSEHAYKLGLVSGRRGNLCNFSKLKAKQIKEIRELRANNCLSYTRIANRYNVSRSAIIQIVQRKVWNHI